MANIIPRLTDTQINKIRSTAEQEVYKALDVQIPNNWLIIYSLEFVMTTSSHYNSHGDREADFVIFAPEYGVLVIEVKGGGISYNNQMPQWYSTDIDKNRHEIKNPLKQAKDVKYEIQRHLKKELPNKQLLISHSALFPDIDNAIRLVNPSAPIELMGTRKNLNDLKSWIISVFDYWSGKEPIFDPLENMGLNVVKRIYGNEVSIQPSLSLLIEDEEAKQIILTKQQKIILRQLRTRKEAIIEGGAGTGKTLLALDHAKNLAKEGLSILFLCYNEKLGEFLKRESNSIENLDSMNFHEFCSWRILQVKDDTGRDLEEESRNDYPTGNKFDILMPNALINSYEIAPIQYDVIIIDEGQDFKNEYWFAIEMLKDMQEDTKLYIFKDGNQAIYTNNCELPITPESLNLFDNCRNTDPIHNLAYKYYNGIEVSSSGIEGKETPFIIDSSIEKQAILIDKKVAQLINEEGIKPKEIAVIVMSDFYKAEELLRKSRNKKFWAFKEFSPQDKVLVETARRFKGLESNIIFLWILDSSNMSDKMLYVSISRARFRLFIVGDEGIESIK